jgi:hypothetical protein
MKYQMKLIISSLFTKIKNYFKTIYKIFLKTPSFIANLWESISRQQFTTILKKYKILFNKMANRFLLMHYYLMKMIFMDQQKLILFFQLIWELICMFLFPFFISLWASVNIFSQKSTLCIYNLINISRVNMIETI